MTTEKKYPINLIDAVVGLHFDQNPTGEFNLDDPVQLDLLTNWVEGVLLQGLGDRIDMIRLLHCRFRDRATLQQAADSLGIGREQVRQKEAKALRLLRHPSRAKKLLFVRTYLEEHPGEQVRFSEILTAYEQREEEWEKQKRQLELEKNLRREMSIELFEFSPRTFNCLKRVGILTVADLVQHMTANADEVAKIRNLGAKSFEEIRTKLVERGMLDEYE